jgi:DNA-binding SARP family transcriptional activator
MPQKPPPIAKITSPRPARIFHRDRLYRLLDRSRAKPLLWIAGPPGAGKTTLIAGYLSRRHLRTLWYRVDPHDADVATFFHYLESAAAAAGARRKAFLPPFTPEYLPNPAPFARRFFRSLFGALPAPLFLVFDNLQEVASPSLLYDLLREGLEEVPAGGRVALISREEPPPSFARFRANQSMEVIDWEDLRLTEREAEGIVRLHRGPKGSREPVRPLHARTDGWTAGLILLLKGGGEANRQPATPLLFDYFAGEIFDRIDPVRQDFLSKSAFLPEITPKTAEALTGVREAGQILSALNRQRFFIERKEASEPIYQYHPLFRDFLCARAEARFDAATLLKIKRRAGEVLESSGQVEGAIDLFLDGEGIEAAIGLILRKAPEIVAQGRYHTLAGWLSRLPPDRFDDLRGMVVTFRGMVGGDTETGGRNGNHAFAWLRYWRGCCRLPFDPAAGRADFEAAFRSLRERHDDPAGIFLSWAGFVEATLFVANEFAYLDRWIADLEALVERFPDFPDQVTEARVAAAMTIALLYHRPDHPRIAQWAERAAVGGAAMEDPSLRVLFCVPAANYYSWIGHPARFQSVMTVVKAAAADPRATPLSRILACVWEGLSVFYGAAPDPVRHAADEGLEIAAANGVHVQDFFLFKAGVVAAVDEGDTTGAADYLARMAAIVCEPQMTCNSLYYYSAAWVKVHQNDWGSAAQHIEQSRLLTARQGLPIPELFSCLLSAYISNMRDLGEAAEAMLAAVRRLNKKIGSKLISYMHDLCEAHLCLVVRGRNGDATARREQGLAALRRAMALSRECGFFCVGTFPRAALARLCAEALSAGIEIDHVRAQVRRYRIGPPDSVPLCPEWPWSIRIRTLGGFSLLIDDQPIPPARKTPRRPLSLLQALIALGGREVRESRLIDLLWPDAEGDAAHWAFAIALRRLRKLLGAEGALLRADGRLTLDPRRVGVDVWAVEALLDRIESLLPESPPSEIFLPLTERLLPLYRGPFLDGITEEAWVLPLRDRLHRRMMKTLSALGMYWKGAKRWEVALRCYEKAEALTRPEDAADDAIARGLAACRRRLRGRTETV